MEESLGKMPEKRIMRVIVGFALFLLSIPWPVDARAQGSTSSVIRVPSGFEVWLPDGGSWQETRYNSVKIRLRNPRLTLEVLKPSDGTDYAERQMRDPDFVGKSRYRRLADGSEVRWQFLGWSMKGYVRKGATTYLVNALFDKLSDANKTEIEQALFDIALTLRSVPPSGFLTHPSAAFEVKIPEDPRAEIEAEGPFIKINRLGFHIYAYSAPDTLRDLHAVIADIIGYFEKRGIRYHAPQRLVFPGGEALWAEAPDTETPLVGAVSREGKFYFVRVRAETVEEDLRKFVPQAPKVWESFLDVMRSVRPAIRP